MAWEVAFWIFSFALATGELGIIVYQLLCLSDLEFDFINPYDSSSRINKFVLPEYVIHATLTAFYLITGYWFMFLVNLPLLYYNVTTYLSGRHLVDVTEIFNQLEPEKKKRFFRLGFYLGLLCLILYMLVMSCMEYVIESGIGSVAEI